MQTMPGGPPGSETKTKSRVHIQIDSRPEPNGRAPTSTMSTESRPGPETGTISRTYTQVDPQPELEGTTSSASLSVDNQPQPATMPPGEGQATKTSQLTTSIYKSSGSIFETNSATTGITPLSGGTILGIVLGSIAVVVIALCASRVYIQRKNRERARKKARGQWPTARIGNATGGDFDLKRLPDLPKRTPEM